jgi:hypothetical protein
MTARVIPKPSAMKQLKKIMPIALMLFALGACNKQSEMVFEAGQTKQTPVEETQIDLSYINFIPRFSIHDLNSDRSSSTADLYTNDFHGHIVGTTTMSRQSEMFTATVTTSEATNIEIDGHACTLWALIWNGPDEAFAGFPPYALYGVAGTRASATEDLTISGTVREGQTINFYPTTSKSVPLQDAENAFVVLMLKSHGLQSEEITTEFVLPFMQGCEHNDNDGEPTGPCRELAYSLQF